MRRLTYRTAPAWGSRLRRMKVLATHRHAEIRFEGPARLGPGFSVWIPDRGALIIGPGVEFRRGFRIEIAADGRVVIGAGTTFTYECLIQCTTSIEIGQRCLFGQSVLIVDGSHRFRDPSLPIGEQGYDYRPIRIGDDVAVMTKSTVIADIGEHSFVGANSVVTRDVPPYSLAVGAPARVIESFGPQ